MKAHLIYQIQKTTNRAKEVRRKFGQGPRVSVFTLGTMRSINSANQMHAVTKAAVLAGINHLETSPSYGPAERFLGKVIKQLQEENIEPLGGWVITSKILPGLNLKEGKEHIKSILERLGLNRIDNLAVHGLNLKEHLAWALDGDGSDLLQWAKEENLVGQIGFSSHGSFALVKQAIESNRFEFCSLHLHLLDQRKIPLAKIALSKGMGVMAISPADKGGQLQNPSQTLIQDCSPINPLELAYRFLLTEGISTLTVGAFEPKDLDLAKKLANFVGPLNELEKRSINNLRKAMQSRLDKDLCKLCEACIPCPNNVPIPEILHLRNLLIGHDLKSFTQERYNLIGKAGHWGETINASSCEACGQCIPQCPNDLNIPILLKETHKNLLSKPIKRLWG